MNLRKRPRLLWFAVFVVILAGGAVIFLATWTIPPPTARIEKVIPNERLAR
ncbi:MAG: hypothetical protein ACT4P2_13475 [Pseudomonadota bacterium]